MILELGPSTDLMSVKKNPVSDSILLIVLFNGQKYLFLAVNNCIYRDEYGQK